VKDPNLNRALDAALQWQKWAESVLQRLRPPSRRESCGPSKWLRGALNSTRAPIAQLDRATPS
jgi:hypothetical protein